MPLLTLGFFCLRRSRKTVSLTSWKISASHRTSSMSASRCCPSASFSSRYVYRIQHLTETLKYSMMSVSDNDIYALTLDQIPSNMILYRVGPGKWLTLQLFLFGIVSTFQAFQTNYGSFVATRLLLGITESGFIPGGLWTLSTW